MKKGYKPVASQPDLVQLVRNLTALKGLEEELLQRVESLPNRRITRKELIRDLGFTPSALRLLAKSKWYAPDSNGHSRETYDLKTALRVRVLFSGLAAAPQVRTERKRNNIISVMKETFKRIVWNNTLQVKPPGPIKERLRSALSG